MELSGYRLLWLQVLYDLPVTTKEKMKAASDFRSFLLDQGFEMSQYSVYQRCCSGKDMADSLVNKIESNLPRFGKIHIIKITDKQYEKIITFHGTSEGLRKKKTENPDQLFLF